MKKQSDLSEGLSREEYVRQQVCFDGFSVLEDDWQVLLQWITKVSENLCFYNLQLEKSGDWGAFWKNQLLVILNDVVLLDTEACKREFVANKGTGKERERVEELESFIKGVLARLERCEYNLVLNHRTEKGQGGVLEEIASELSGRLKGVVDEDGKGNMLKLTEESTSNSLSFFRMLDTLDDIRKRSEGYLCRMLACGEMEPALAVLYIFLKNYTRQVAGFNRRLGDLPVFYMQEILKSRPRGALPDHCWIVLNKVPDMDSVIVPAGTAFVGGSREDGSDLHYLTKEQVVVTGMQLEQVYAVLLKQSDSSMALYRREIPLLAGEEVPELFGCGEGACECVPVGWMIESRMFDLREGQREVCLSLFLTEGVSLVKELMAQPDGQRDKVFENAFVIKVSSPEGWLEAESCCTRWDAEQECLVIRFVLGLGMPAVVACMEEVHGVVTGCPAIQMVLNEDPRFFPYAWASRVSFGTLAVKVNVSGITTLKLYSEYGELDPSVPFYPFGVQAKKGAWFVFGNYEMACKPLNRVTLSYNWQQLPSEEGGFAEHYANYQTKPPINNLSFEVGTEWLKDRKWVSQLGTPFLFEGSGADSRLEEYGSVTFWMDGEMPVVDVSEENYVLGKSRTGFMRVVLTAPEIGFGSELYRQLFARVMLANSHKGKEVEPLPAEPIAPMMSDMELSYEAEDIFSLNGGNQKTSARFYQLKPLAWTPFLPVVQRESYMIAEPLSSVAHLLFAFSGAKGSGTVRFYFDISMRKDETGFSDRAWNDLGVSWYYNDGRDWQLLPSEQVLQENTHVFTHAGLVELALPVPVAEDWLDEEGRFWVCASIRGDYRECRLVRGFYMHAVEVVADGGDGSSLPVGTITQSAVALPGIESVNQFVAGAGGCPPEDGKYLSLRIAHRIAHRRRAVNPVDFERMALQEFPVLEKVRCIPVTENEWAFREGKVVPQVLLVVMSREQGGKYPLCSLTTLQEIRKRFSAVISPFLKLEVTNPVYEKIRVHCKVRLQQTVYVGAVLRKLQNKISFYIAPWLYKKEMPELNRGLSLQGLYTILVNEEAVAELKCLKLERVEVTGPEKKYQELELLPGGPVPVAEVWMMESVCGGVFIPDESHVINYE